LIKEENKSIIIDNSDAGRSPMLLCNNILIHKKLFR